MIHLKTFESFELDSNKNFYNTNTLDTKKMSIQDIIQVIKNTFETADLVWESPDWTVVVTDWRKLMGEGNSLSMSARMISEIGDEETKKVYFHIHKSGLQSVIIRSQNREALKSAAKDLSNFGGKPETGINLSAIVNFSRPVYNISFSSRPIDVFGQSLKDEVGLHTLQPLVTNEIELDKSLAELSNILIGQNIISRKFLYKV
jgi:hypothetical protein